MARPRRLVTPPGCKACRQPRSRRYKGTLPNSSRPNVQIHRSRVNRFIWEHGRKGREETTKNGWSGCRKCIQSFLLAHWCCRCWNGNPWKSRVQLPPCWLLCCWCFGPRQWKRTVASWPWDARVDQPHKPRTARSGLLKDAEYGSQPSRFSSFPAKPQLCGWWQQPQYQHA
jgi:hypothetical protein